MNAAFVGAFAHRRLNRTAAAEALLVAAERASSSDWTVSVVTFLRGRLSAADFLRKAKGSAQQIEARAFVGVAVSVEGRVDDALSHLRWARDRSAAGLAAQDLALAELRRTEQRAGAR